ncbi:Sec-independent protein translocase subunit TatA/TatB [Granulicella sibirica]|uniref:Twin-arginine translocation protein TatB n=1 Tax=Granulicella sibirica TaxID=2479048 RepID=A0A4Q0T0C6_9BACT|nr:twin-arginine translocase TatA/TatE family subunit [Granulicella sibirica]RXH55249.1 Twin-arginine translocation protein TatB [Granulicella sibirica]
MPSFQDSAVIFIIALLLFGPRKLPELARQLGKLMGEFRRASNDFRMQMEDELRMTEQAERQKEIAAIEAAAPRPAIAAPAQEEPVAESSYTSSPVAEEATTSEPLPIASSGELKMMPPSTGLPTARGAVSDESESALTPLLESIPEAPPNRTEFADHTIHTPDAAGSDAHQADHHG